MNDEERGRVEKDYELVTEPVPIKQKPTIDVTKLDIECDGAGGTHIKVWCKCRTVEEVEDIIAWLNFAKGVMVKWKKVRT